MAIPLVHLLEDPLDNEIKLWGMIKNTQRSLDGAGAPLAGWGSSSGPQSDGGALIGAGSGLVGVACAKNTPPIAQALTEVKSWVLSAGNVRSSMGYVDNDEDFYIHTSDATSGGGNANYNLSNQVLYHVVGNNTFPVDKVPPVDTAPTINSVHMKSDEASFAFDPDGGGGGFYYYSVARNLRVSCTMTQLATVQYVTKRGNSLYTYQDNGNPFISEYNATSGGAAVRTSSALNVYTSVTPIIQVTESYLYALVTNAGTQKIIRLNLSDFSVADTFELSTTGYRSFDVVDDNLIYLLRRTAFGGTAEINYLRDNAVHVLDATIALTNPSIDFPTFRFHAGYFYLAESSAASVLKVGPVNCPGTCAAAPVLVLGTNGQITPVNTKTLTVNWLDQRVGVGTCNPLATLDLYTKDAAPTLGLNCDTGIIIDFRSDKSTLVNARIRSAVTTAPAVRMEIQTLDSASILKSRVLVSDMVDVTPAFALSGDLTPAQITVDTANYNPSGLATATILRLSTDASRQLTGLAGGADGRVIIPLNVGSNDLTLLDEGGGSSDANRFALPTTTLTIPPETGTILVYDSTSSRWRPVGYLPHRLLSLSHSDTVAASPVSGDIIYANATPAWTKLAKGTDGQVLTLASGLPSWATPTTGTVTGTGTNGQVAFWTAASVLSGESGLLWDATNNILDVSNAGGGRFLVNAGTFLTTVDSTASFVLGGTTGPAWVYLNSGIRFNLSSNQDATALSPAQNSLILALRGHRWTGAASVESMGTLMVRPSATIDDSRIEMGFADNNSQMLNITHGGRVGINDTSPDAMLDVVNNSASLIGLIVQGAASQTANLQEWQNSSSTVLGAITSAGKFALGQSTADYMIEITAPNGNILYATSASDALISLNRAGTPNNNGFSLLTAGTEKWRFGLLGGLGSDAHFRIAANDGVSGLLERVKITDGGSVVVNEGSVNGVSFRIEGNTNANLFVTDGDSDRVGIGTNAPTVSQTGTGLHIADGNAGLRLQNTSADGWGYIEFYDESAVAQFISGYRDADNSYRIVTGNSLGGTSGLIIDNAGVLRFGTHTALGAETVTGYITIKDAGGTTRKLAVVS